MTQDTTRSLIDENWYYCETECWEWNSETTFDLGMVGDNTLQTLADLGTILALTSWVTEQVACPQMFSLRCSCVLSCCPNRWQKGMAEFFTQAALSLQPLTLIQHFLVFRHKALLGSQTTRTWVLRCLLMKPSCQATVSKWHSEKIILQWKATFFQPPPLLSPTPPSPKNQNGRD